MPTKLVQKWYKKIIVGKKDYKNKIVGRLYQFCSQYNNLNNRGLDTICLQNYKNREFLQLFFPTANSDASNNRLRPMEAEAIDTPSTTLAQMKPTICEREEKQIMMMQNSEYPSHQKDKQNL
jgi:hypothetical protein